MKQLASALQKMAAAALFAAALTGCARNEYAMLPKTSSYHGDQHRSVAVKPAAPVAEQTAPAVVADEPVAPAATVAAAVKDEAAAPRKAAKVAKQERAEVAAAPAAKPNMVQKALVAKALKKVDKLAAKAELKKQSNAASADDANALAKNIKLGIILLLIGVLLGIFGGIIGLLGLIFAIIGIVLIVLGLLEEI
ncbi:hypothetical protein [Solirubrum puertoriconensis]|uniref:Uncharacterized protein n=1 Tax=Solirubrum puertoriconensis TaxID=1751427 RepID=A0A9X0HJ36_SOLP1|nr:hypothetical protein [Solirubrum puertoriconensis]KUG06812.1 hypothetical protein ASU33_05655 [Solirubrum puertoriconensis]